MKPKGGVGGPLNSKTQHFEQEKLDFAVCGFSLLGLNINSGGPPHMERALSETEGKTRLRIGDSTI